ncbi:hypothetical protein BDN72DRAFT_789744 [Pluteus cervinus]|uniref:Uncharacterized protein n=1 Tax=Pluteus cervinus TaxID=181527 RepID=A0ACD3B8G9_9AGAR|nr:hypothetical protein BDN72DRAFT_789744 [Pluteus cervinus]
MFGLEQPHGPGNQDGPALSDQWKRAVLRPPPSRFVVEMLPPAKQGGSYSFGMRVSPIVKGDRASYSSRGWSSDYEIWRRWEDCLWFQGTLELEYRRAAREKRQRLLQGKGVKKGGFYKQDQASSWESLPPGPDPNSVAQELHDFLPKLTKKGTLFRASQATTDQRQREISALIDALMQPDQPALVQELMSNPAICDFFGFWQRDQDLLLKLKGKQKPRSSVTSSVFSAYFSSTHSLSLETDSAPSTPSSKLRPPPSLLRSPSPSSRLSTSTARSPTSPYVSPSRPSTSSGLPMRTRTPDTLRTPQTKFADLSPGSTPEFVGRRRAFSTTSTDSSSAQSSTSSENHSQGNLPIVVDEVPILFDHNPHYPQDDRPSSVLSALPEDQAESIQFDSDYAPVQRKKSSSHRHGHIFVQSPRGPMEHRLPEISSIENLATDRQTIRESWQTTDSGATLLRGLDMILPDDPRNRASMLSMATFMTESSAEAVLPRTPRTKVPSDVSDTASHLAASFEDDEFWDQDGNRIDPAYFDAFPIPTSFVSPTKADGPLEPTDSRPVTALGHLQTPSKKSVDNLSCLFAPSPKSPPKGPSAHKAPTTPPPPLTFKTSAIGATPARSNIPDIISIKAAHNNAIIMLKISREATFEDVKKKLYNKFVGQEGVPLNKSFSVSFVTPLPGHESFSDHEGISVDPQMELVNGQDDWELIMYGNDTNKFTLRITDTQS